MQIIANEPGWVRDATLQGMVSSSESQMRRNANRMNSLAKRFNLDPVEVVIDDLNKEKRDQRRKARASRNLIKDITSPIMRASDPIAGWAQVVNTATSLGGKAVSKTADFASGFAGKSMAGKFIKGVDKVAGGSLKAMGYLASFSAGTSAMVMSLEKDYRAMIELGAIAPKSSMQYEVLRGASADVGMSLAETAKFIEGSGGMMSKIGGDIFAGTTKFIDFAKRVEYGGDGISDFGYGAQDLANRMKQEAELLYELNDLQEGDLTVKGRVYKNFENIEKMLTGMADWTGARKSELLEDGLNAAKNIDAQLSLVQNRKYMEETYGKGTTDAVAQNRRRLSMLFAQVPELQKGVMEGMDTFIQDIEFNGENAAVAFNQDFIIALQQANPAAADKLIKIVQDAGTGKLEGIDLDLTVKDFLVELRNSNTTRLPTEMGNKINTLIAEANVFPNLDKADSEIRESYKNASNASEKADDMRDSMDDLSKAYRNVYATATPVFNATGQLFSSTTEALSEMANALGADLDLNDIEEYYQKREERNKTAEENLQKILSSYGPDFMKAAPRQRGRLIETAKAEYRKDLESANLTATLPPEFADAERKRIDDLVEKRFSGLDVRATTDKKPVAGGLETTVFKDDTASTESPGPIEKSGIIQGLGDAFQSMQDWMSSFFPESMRGSNRKVVPRDDNVQLHPEIKSQFTKPVAPNDETYRLLGAREGLISSMNELDGEIKKSFGVDKARKQERYDAMAKELNSILAQINSKINSQNINQEVHDGR